MTWDSQRPEGAAHDEITRALGEILAPPGGEAYWQGLESRVMARIGSSGQADIGPWSVLATWMRPAMVAAAAAVILCAAAVLHTQQADARVAYESLMAPLPGAAPVEAAIRPALLGERDVTLSMLIAH